MNRRKRTIFAFIAQPSTGVLLLALSLGAGATAPAAAKDDGTWPVTGKLIGKDGKKSKDASGIACTTTQGFPRSCLVIDDNLQDAQFVTVRDGEIIAGRPVPLIEDTYKGKPLELDGEGVAYADGFFYVIGSHGRPRKAQKPESSRAAAKIKAKIAASSQLVRIPVDWPSAGSAIKRTNRLTEIIAAEPALAEFANQPLNKNGLTIEGVAVRRGRLLVGFRGPTLEHGRAAVLSVALDALFDGGRPDARLYRLPLGDGQGVRDLAPLDDGILVLAGPAAGGAGTYEVYWWDGESERVRLLQELKDDVVGKKGKRKPEALLPLDKTSSRLRVLILFDGEKEGAPTVVEMPGP